jgi:hypothetical protein
MIKFAASSFDVSPIGGVLRKTQDPTQAGNVGTNLDNFVSTINVIVYAATVVSGLILLGMLITGGILYMSSQGDEKQLNKAKKQITDALIGFVIVALAWWVIRILGTVFGISLLIPVFEGL